MKNFLTLLTFMLLLFYNAKSLPRKIGSSGNSLLKKTNAAPEYLSANLYAINADGSISLQDGNLTLYDPLYSNSIDLNDFRKLNNFAENFGIARGNATLAIEKRQPVKLTDTITFKMWQMQQKSYQLELVASNIDHPGLIGLLEDNYLHTSIEIGLNNTTKINFSINPDAGSADIHRFRIIYKTALKGPLSVTITTFKAIQQNKDIQLEWKTGNEIDIKQYVLEKSINGLHFTNAVTITDIRNNNNVSAYQYIDQSPFQGITYYRIKSVKNNGQIEYSQVLKVSSANAAAAVTVFPNPISGNAISLQINNMPAGIYTARLINNYGQVISLKQIIYQGGAAAIKIEYAKSILTGTYHLQVISPGEEPKNIKILVLKD